MVEREKEFPSLSCRVKPGLFLGDMDNYLNNIE